MVDYRQISREELEKILSDHCRWFETLGKEGAKADLFGADLREADLREADLREADLRGANLQGVNLREANLQGADIQGADLQGAGLQGADLQGAGLQGAALWGADLRGADLERADLERADLRGADLRGADLQSTLFEYAEIKDTKVSSRKALADVKIGNYDGFVFEDEERVEGERRQREERAGQLGGEEEDGTIIISTRDSVHPADVAQALLWVSFFYEGVRLALTTPYENEDDLLYQCLHPGLYGALNEAHALKLVSVQNGSLEFLVTAKKYVWAGMKSVWKIAERVAGHEAKMEELRQQDEKQKHLMKKDDHLTSLHLAKEIKDDFLKDPDLPSEVKKELVGIMLAHARGTMPGEGELITEDQASVVYTMGRLARHKWEAIADKVDLKVKFGDDDLLEE